MVLKPKTCTSPWEWVRAEPKDPCPCETSADGKSEWGVGVTGENYQLLRV